MKNTKLTDEEKLFCDLYALGDAPFAGNPVKCYTEAFHNTSTSNRVRIKAMALLQREDIKEYLNSLEEMSFEEQRYMKKFVSQNLMSIVEECSTAEYRDRKGKALSPAPLRSVAVQASKALMDLHGVKKNQVTKVSVEGAGEGGITFNVIMPQSSSQEPEIDNAE